MWRSSATMSEAWKAVSTASFVSIKQRWQVETKAVNDSLIGHSAASKRGCQNLRGSRGIAMCECAE